MTEAHCSPFAKVHSPSRGAAKWTDGFWARRFEQCCQITIPTMGRLMCQSERARFLGNFEVAAGLAEGRHRGPKWNDGDFYKWLEAAAAMLAITSDPQLERDLDAVIDLVARTQCADGYLHTDVQIAQRAGADARRFGNPMDFEMYNMGHLITAACVHHDSTGKSNLLSVARKAADFLVKEFESPTAEQARHGICPSHLMGLIDLYRTTGDARYRDLAVKLLNMRDLVTGGDDDNQDRIPLRQQTQAVGHAVRATYLYAGAAAVYAETGDTSLLEPLQAIWSDLVAHKLYITGGCGALFDGASPDGARDQSQIKRVHQAFGRNYQLPNSTAHNETCAAVGSVLWNWRMFQITGEARFADLVEHTLYNSVLAGISLDGTRYFYTNTLRNVDPMPTELRWPRERQASLGCFCCPPNVARTLARASEYAYAQSERRVWCVLYGGSRLETTLSDADSVQLSQQTDYPWDGAIAITIDVAPKMEFSLLLRIPAWAAGARVRVNGATAERASPGTFHEVRRTWSAGDRVELDLPMRPRWIEAHPYVEETRNQVAAMRGPIVYCLESTDLPEGVRILDVTLRADCALVVGERNPQLDNVPTLRGTAVSIRSAAHDWSNQLYRDFALGELREFQCVLVPYFTWGNRGASEMTVWMPAARQWGHS